MGNILTCRLPFENFLFSLSKAERTVSFSSCMIYLTVYSILLIDVRYILAFPFLYQTLTSLPIILAGTDQNRHIDLLGIALKSQFVRHPRHPCLLATKIPILIVLELLPFIFYKKSFPLCKPKKSATIVRTVYFKRIYVFSEFSRIVLTGKFE